MKKVIMICVFIVVLMSSFGCKVQENIELEILYQHDVMYVGEQQMLTYQLTPNQKGEFDFTWLSSDDKVINIDENGNCQALTAGKATISLISQKVKKLSAIVDIFVISLPEAQTNTLITDYSILEVGISQTYLDHTSDKVMVTVTLTAKKAFTAILSTGSFERLGLIEMQIVNRTNEKQEYYLYSELYMIAVTDDEYEFTLLEGEMVTRSLQFATLPFVFMAGDEVPAPRGEYQVQVRVALFGEPWLDTGLTIVVS
ncbi:MAG: Ig-like domain-containing protein [Bacilli bacterium]|nr:Ig-like domain-containing protein [Bacilli bacterium]